MRKPFIQSANQLIDYKTNCTIIKGKQFIPETLELNTLGICSRFLTPGEFRASEFVEQ